MDKDTFFTTKPSKSVEVNLLYKSDMKKVAGMVGILYSKFHERNESGCYFYHQSDKPVLPEHFDALKGLL
ncbi:hypothetical protein ACTHGW_15240 [Bacillus velezensis]|uniref:hypothetical protein n=1 Tax=Bacillus velezensis TaxID=492670 RepID=UPI00069D579D|nr:hypothetical protein [Bacillus velezensis]KOC21186.1 hypothetical protein AC810_16955 [Bacillus velezensis]KOC22136.1 hypothetical protein AC811_16790 [Bacillus velezensis]NIH48963.1 hypothetical protein [Bacillus velezensis]